MINYDIVTTEKQFNSLLECLYQASVIAFDLETTGLEADGYGFDESQDKIVGWALSTGPKIAWYVPVRHTQGKQLPSDLVVDKFKPIFEDLDKTFLIHNAKFDTHFVEAEGICMDFNNVEDTMLEAHVAGFKDQLLYVGLKYITETLWDHKQVHFEDLFAGGSKSYNIAEVPIDIAGHYACEDADYCFRVHLQYHDFIQAHENLSAIYYLEKQLWPLVREVEDTGMVVDTDFIDSAYYYLRSEAAKIYKIIVDQIKLKDPTFDPANYKKPIKKKGEDIPYWIVGFNPGSSDQLGEVLYDRLKLKASKYTPGGDPSTDDKTLERLSKSVPVANNIRIYKQMLAAANKLKDEIKGSIKHDGRAHTNYNQVGTRSGRFSSSRPNFQNLAREKKWLVSLDGTSEQLRDTFVSS
jgi:DNA polymerase I